MTRDLTDAEAAALFREPGPKIPEVGAAFERAAGYREKIAVTRFGPLIVTGQAALPLQAPTQPRKVAPAAGLAVNLTDVAAPKMPLHVVDN